MRLVFSITKTRKINNRKKNPKINVSHECRHKNPYYQIELKLNRTLEDFWAPKTFSVSLIFFLDMPQGMQDLSSWTRDQTHAPLQWVNHWTAKEVPPPTISSLEEIGTIQPPWPSLSSNKQKHLGSKGMRNKRGTDKRQWCSTGAGSVPPQEILIIISLGWFADIETSTTWEKLIVCPWV